jgi:hypothetical protein
MIDKSQPKSMRKWTKEMIAYWENYLVQNPNCSMRSNVETTLDELKKLSV